MRVCHSRPTCDPFGTLTERSHSLFQMTVSAPFCRRAERDWRRTLRASKLVISPVSFDGVRSPPGKGGLAARWLGWTKTASHAD